MLLPLKPDHELLLTEDSGRRSPSSRTCGSSPDPDEPPATISPAPGEQMRALLAGAAEVGQQPGHPTLCVRCADAVEFGLVCRPAA